MKADIDAVRSGAGTSSHPATTRAPRFLAAAIDRFHNPIAAWVVLVCGIAITIAAWFVSSTALERRAAERFDFRSREIQKAISDRLHVYEEVLWGGAGLVNAIGMPTRAQFHQYVETLDLDRHWPGIQGIGLSVPVPPAEKQAHIDRIRAEGFPEYEIRPAGEREEYTAIVYLEPFDWRNQRAFGFDMWANEVRREAMRRARDTGIAATSGLITLVQETESEV